jgi:arsenite methyltransferase
VGNPHLLAKIQPGEKVLDLGSGLGIDSFIASHYAGPEGRVIGLDISAKEVKHAQSRADARGLKTKFVNADIESIPLPDGLIDVVISNGAFCLVPSKVKAFSEIFRVLRPGGRMAVCTSTIKMNLEEGV